jgi:hypothetical protein
MSVSVRTAVVLPVPPFWERTAIVSAMRPDYRGTEAEAETGFTR